MPGKCARCGREAPPAIEGPEGQTEQGWVTYEGERILVVDVPAEPSILSPEIIAAMAEPLDDASLIQIDPTRGVEAPAIRESVVDYLGNACPDCQRETGWDDFTWSLFIAGLTKESD